MQPDGDSSFPPKGSLLQPPTGIRKTQIFHFPPHHTWLARQLLEACESLGSHAREVLHAASAGPTDSFDRAISTHTPVALRGGGEDPAKRSKHKLNPNHLIAAICPISLRLLVPIPEASTVIVFCNVRICSRAKRAPESLGEGLLLTCVPDRRRGNRNPFHCTRRGGSLSFNSSGQGHTAECVTKLGRPSGT